MFDDRQFLRRESVRKKRDYWTEIIASEFIGDAREE
jgi:hypothetical protein